jgi:hypothetical protein
MLALCVYARRCGARVLGEILPSEEIEQFIAISRKSLAGAYVKIASETLTPSELSTMWSLIRGVEAAMKLGGISLEDELEQLDRDLEDLFRPSKRTHEILEPTEFLF